MYVTMTGEKDAASLQQDLDWEEKWQMKFHPQKCSVLRITRNKSTKIFNCQFHSHTLKSDTDRKYLGVRTNNKLSWNNHMDSICNKTNSSIDFLRRNLQISQHHIKTNAYFTLVRPQVEYAAMVWDPNTKENIKKIEMVQRHTARYVCKNYVREEGCVTEMLEQLGWRSLLRRRVDIRLVFLYKCVHGLVAVDISNDLIPETRPSCHCNSMSCNIPIETRTYIQKKFRSRGT